MINPGNTKYLDFRQGGISNSDHKTDILKSCLQKAIRRGDNNIAQFCAVQLDLFGYIDNGKAIRTNMINRLRVTLAEDAASVLSL